MSGEFYITQQILNRPLRPLGRNLPGARYAFWRRIWLPVTLKMKLIPIAKIIEIPAPECPFTYLKEHTQKENNAQKRERYT